MYTEESKPLFKKNQTDGWTDRRMDGRTNRRTDEKIDILNHRVTAILKIHHNQDISV